MALFFRLFCAFSAKQLDLRKYHIPHMSTHSSSTGSGKPHKRHHSKRQHSITPVTGKRSCGVIGGGISGMAAAARMAAAGYSVTLYEAGPELGGKLTDYRWEDFRFDKGPSLFTMPEHLNELFVVCGKRLDDYLQYDRLELVTRYFYPEGTRVDAWSEPARFAQELSQQVGEDPQRVRAYLKRAELMYETTAPVFLHKSLHDWRNLLRFSTFLKVLRIPWLGINTTMHRFNKKWFKHERTVQLFDRFATYNGSDPYRAPATLNLISHIELNKGAFYPKGGMIAIRDAMAKLLLEMGVQVRLNTRVDRLFVHEGKVKGVVIGEQKDVHQTVISGIDIMQAEKRLIPRHYRNKKRLNTELSTSAIIFHWAVKGHFPKLDLHNIFFTGHYHREFEYLKKGKLAADPTLYVYVSSKVNQQDAPQGHENWFVMVNTPPHLEQDWDSWVAEVRTYAHERLSEALGVNTAALVLHESVMDPRDLERNTGSLGGAIYGPASNNKWAAFLRQANKHQKLKNLYFVGGSVHPGGGIPLCLLSAKITAELIGANRS